MFKYAEILWLCGHFNMKQSRGSQIYAGMGHDGNYRMVRVDVHGRGDDVRSGSAKRMAQQFGFHTVEQMRKYIDEHR